MQLYSFEFESNPPRKSRGGVPGVREKDVVAPYDRLLVSSSSAKSGGAWDPDFHRSYLN